MKNNSEFKVLEKLNFFIIVCVIAILFTIAIPLPPIVLDILSAISFLLAVILLPVCFILKAFRKLLPLPTVLIIVTLFRLFLNAGFTKLLFLNRANDTFIHRLGEFFVGNHYVVALPNFILFVLVIFIIIMYVFKRVSEITARFTLDRMPGKQLMIDAELNSGLIDEEEAKERRKELEKELDFYGTLDGALHFIKIDAIVGIILAFLNVAGGFIYGTKFLSMDFSTALATYTILAAGAGLIYQIPAFLISMVTLIFTSTMKKNDFKKNKNNREQQSIFSDNKAIDVQISNDLVPLIESFDLLEHVAALRKQLKQDYNFDVPSIRVRDNLSLEQNTYVIDIDGHTVTGNAVLDKNNADKIIEEILNKLADAIKKHK